MLDADASFRLDTDGPALLRNDPLAAALGLSSTAQDILPTETLPDRAADPAPGAQPVATLSPDDLTASEPAAADPSDSAADPRPITPRRLLRFSAARAAEDAPIHALPVLNVFDGVFEYEDDLTDPRLLRSRARVRRLLAAHEAGLSDAERNLWHDDPQPEPVPAAAPAAQEPQGRRIRHLTAADIAPHPREPVRDPLRDRLHAAREALYTPHPDDPPPVHRPGLAERLTVQAMTAAILIVSWPIGIALAAVTLLRGEDLRLTARTMAMVGTGTALLQVVPHLPI